MNATAAKIMDWLAVDLEWALGLARPKTQNDRNRMTAALQGIERARRLLKARITARKTTGRRRAQDSPK